MKCLNQNFRYSEYKKEKLLALNLIRLNFMGYTCFGYECSLMESKRHYRIHVGWCLYFLYVWMPNLPHSKRLCTQLVIIPVDCVLLYVAGTITMHSLRVERFISSTTWTPLIHTLCWSCFSTIRFSLSSAHLLINISFE